MGGTVLSVRDAKVSETIITPGLGGLRGMGTQTTGQAIRKQGDKHMQLCDEGSLVASMGRTPSSQRHKAGFLVEAASRLRPDL